MPTWTHNKHSYFTQYYDLTQQCFGRFDSARHASSPRDRPGPTAGVATGVENQGDLIGNYEAKT